LFTNNYHETKRVANRLDGFNLRLAPFRFKTEHISGERNVVADVLSRLKSDAPKPYVEGREVLELGRVHPQINALFKTSDATTISVETVREHTMKDMELQKIIEAIETKEWKSKAELRTLRPFADEFFVKKGIVMRGLLIMLPTTLRRQAMINAHIAHSGVTVMKRTLRDRVWWPAMDKEIMIFVNECVGCTAVAKDNPPEPMERSRLPEQPMDIIAIDHWSSQVLSTKVLVLTCFYSRYLFTEVVRDETAASTIEVCQRLFARFGKPREIRADNGPAFASEEFRDWCQQEGIDVEFATPLWAQSNGLVERCMQFINKNLRIARLTQENWRRTLSNIVTFYNNERLHTVTGVTPGELMFGRRLRATIPILSVSSQVVDGAVRDADWAAKMKGKEAEDRKRHAKGSDIQVGDTVFPRGKGTDKLSANFNVEEPCIVVEKDGSSLKYQNTKGQIFTRNSTAVKKNFDQQFGPVDNDLTNPETKSTDAETSANGNKTCAEGRKEGTKRKSTEEATGGSKQNERRLRDRQSLRAPSKFTLNTELWSSGSIVQGENVEL
jgi:hypothetical protein